LKNRLINAQVKVDYIPTVIFIGCCSLSPSIRVSKIFLGVTFPYHKKLVKGPGMKKYSKFTFKLIIDQTNTAIV